MAHRAAHERPCGRRPRCRRGDGAQDVRSRGQPLRRAHRRDVLGADRDGDAVARRAHARVARRQERQLSKRPRAFSRRA